MLQQKEIRQQNIRSSTLRLQHAIQDFKKVQVAKTSLFNKINILKHKQETNRKKIKILESNLTKRSLIQLTYIKEKEDMRSLLEQQRWKQQKTLHEARQKREKSKENIQIIKDIISDVRKSGYLKMKQIEKINQKKIVLNQGQQKHEKRQKTLQVKLQQQSSRLTKTMFFEKKKIKAKREAQSQILPLQLSRSFNQRQIKQMKQLQQMMISKVNQSYDNLARSKATKIPRNQIMMC